MKTRKIIFSLVLLVALFLVACSPQAVPTDVSAAKDMTSADASEVMGEMEDPMMDEQSEEMMTDNEEMSDLSDDAMMEENEDDMMAENNDQTMDDEDDVMMSDHDDPMLDDKDDDAMSEHDDQMMEVKDDSMADDSMAVPDWFNATLTNAQTGEAFMISDFQGKVVLVETLAMWCSNCFKQQGQVQVLHDLIGERDDFVSLGVDIDPHENATALKAYTDKNGFDWLYTVASVEVSREIGQLYGDQYLNPPSTPMLIVDRDGNVHLLPFGIKSAESLLEALQPFLDGEM